MSFHISYNNKTDTDYKYTKYVAVYTVRHNYWTP